MNDENKNFVKLCNYINLNAEKYLIENVYNLSEKEKNILISEIIYKFLDELRTELKNNK